MKKLVKGYELLDKGLNGYIIRNIFMVFEGLEITSKSEDGTKTVKLQFEDVRDIDLDGDGVSGIISDIKLEKTDDDYLETIIEKKEGIGMKIVSQKLFVEKI